MEVLETIPINIRDQHNLLNLLAESYKSLNKALMEYIDNSFDSADDYYDDVLGRYQRDVAIIITIDRANNTISVLDNCNGMDLEILKGLANSINDSEKRRRAQKRPWVNGQFGLGAHAYRFFAQKLRVITKKKNSSTGAISIDRDEPDAKLIKPYKSISNDSGTFVELSDIDRQQIKRLNIQELKRDIETYFEMLLRRNVAITIRDDDQVSVCESFDYDQLEGIPIQKVITSWHRGSATLSYPDSARGIHINLKVCTKKMDRPPFFSRKGRRINYISHMDSFIRKTEHRKKVWENYYLTGYIEVGDNLEPIITRDDFMGGKGKTATRSGIYEEIVKVEDDIYAAIEQVNRDRSDENFRKLASVLTELLTEITKEEDLRIRHENKDGQRNEQPWVSVSPDPGEGEEYDIKSNGNNRPGDKPKISVVTPDLEGELMGRKREREKQGIRIEFSTLPVVEGDRRTHFGDSVITIFTNHPDFSERRGRGDLEQIIINPRLANYLAAIISSEYKEVFYNLKKLEPDRKKVLDEQIEFIFRFEEKLKNYINQPLDALGNVTRS
ncbi:ATP-binding protein [Candidatus Curtissbacteria bacterium]|nr:ATP-binding protein [Candidatus Curtissbacteria bacterium]